MPPLDLKDVSFLIVDDNDHSRLLLRTILNAFGAFKVREAADGADAFKALRAQSAHVVIADYHMTPLDGIAFTRLLRTSPDSPGRALPVIMVSGHTEVRRVAEARDAGINEYLAKPLSAQSLYLRIASVITRPRPFIQSRSYVGPCRRRRSQIWAGPDRRVPVLAGAAVA